MLSLLGCGISTRAPETIELTMPNIAMEPEIRHGDMVMVVKPSKDIDRNSLVAFLSDEISADVPQILRVVGLPGETVFFNTNGIRIFKEPPRKISDISKSIYWSRMHIPMEQHPMIVKDYPHLIRREALDPWPMIHLASDEYYLLGDNYSFAIDSRLLGPIDKEDIIGLVNKNIEQAGPSNRSNATRLTVGNLEIIEE